MIRFAPAEVHPISGRLIYRRTEFSVAFIPDEPCFGGRSLLINDLQLEINEHGRVLYPWGLLPEVGWVEAPLGLPASFDGGLEALLAKPLVLGASQRISDDRWPVTIDRRTRWLCLGDRSANEGAVAFASGCLAVLRGESLAALWLRPDIE